MLHAAAELNTATDALSWPETTSHSNFHARTSRGLNDSAEEKKNIPAQEV